jgi:hypothetical protein
MLCYAIEYAAQQREHITLLLYLHALLMLYCCLYLSEYVAELYPVVIQLLQR